jgi:hypothetical protein
MPIQVKSNGGKDFELIPAGPQQAICYGVIDIGTQKSNNPQHSPKRKLVIIWELPHERADFGEDRKNLPRAISSTFTQSLSERAILKKTLQSWRGKPFTEEELKGFDPKVLIGVNCQLNIVHSTDGKYANVDNVMPLAKGMTKLPQENKALYFSLDDQSDLTNIQYPENMPNWLKEKIAFSEEVMAATNGQHDQSREAPRAPAAQESPDEDVPF